MQKADKGERQTKEDGNRNKQVANYQKGLDKKTLQGIYKFINNIQFDKLNVE